MQTIAGPRTLDELLDVVPGLRRARSINAQTLRLLFGRDKKECTWCGAAVPKGRLTWCSDGCLEEFYIRCSPSHQRELIYRRDGAVCRICQRDIEKCQRVARKVMGSRWRSPDADNVKIAETLGFGGGGWYQIDHIVPVIEGGGLCGGDNLRLVCGACHQEVTRQLAGRRAKKLRL